MIGDLPIIQEGLSSGFFLEENLQNLILMKIYYVNFSKQKKILQVYDEYMIGYHGYVLYKGLTDLVWQKEFRNHCDWSPAVYHKTINRNYQIWALRDLTFAYTDIE